MTFRRFAFNNVLRNKRTYAAYFLSSVFSVLVFFIYAVFAFHPSLAGEGMPNAVSAGLHVAEGIIYVFSFFFVLFSMSAFLKTRKKEFGLMVMHGMSNLQLRTLVFLENTIIGFAATVTGVSLGLIFSKLILLSAETVLGLDNTLEFYVPIEALGLTFAAFMLLFVCISLFTVSFLRGNKLIDLIKGNATPKPEPKASMALSLFAAILLAVGYATAFLVKGNMVWMALLPVTGVVIVGTYFLFTQLSVYAIRGLKRRRNVFWNRTNMLLFSDLSYRMKDNARTFFMVAILSTVAFSAIGSLVGFRAMISEVLIKENPFAMEYTSYSEASEQGHLKKIETVLTKHKTEFARYSAAIKQVQTEGGDQAYFVSETSFNEIAKAAGESTLRLNEGEAAQIVYRNPVYTNAKEDVASVDLTEFGVSASVSGQQESNAFPIHADFYALADSEFAMLPDTGPIERWHVFDIEDWRSSKDAGEELDGYFDDIPRAEAQYSSLAYDLHVMMQGYGVILFIGLFIGIVFFVAAGSFLYFRLYTDLEEDVRKFKSILKLGLTDRELSSVVTKQLLLLFFLPIGVALVHGAVALKAMQSMFEYNLIAECSAVLGAFFAIQAVYFMLARSRYLRQLRNII